jgi:hypothetical protein
MTIATTTEKNSLATKYATDAVAASAHTADPGTTGTSEVSGGSPAYARKTISWGSASGGVVTASVTFDIPASTTVTWIGIWTATTAGTFLDKGTVTSQAFATQGTYTVALTFTVT